MESDETQKLIFNLLVLCKRLEHIEFVDYGNVINEAFSNMINIGNKFHLKLLKCY